MTHPTTDAALDGYDNDDSSDPCGLCEGSGEIEEEDGYTTCPQCNGSGEQ